MYHNNSPTCYGYNLWYYSYMWMRSLIPIKNYPARTNGPGACEITNRRMRANLETTNSRTSNMSYRSSTISRPSWEYPNVRKWVRPWSLVLKDAKDQGRCVWHMKKMTMCVAFIPQKMTPGGIFYEGGWLIFKKSAVTIHTEGVENLIWETLHSDWIWN